MRPRQNIPGNCFLAWPKPLRQNESFSEFFISGKHVANSHWRRRIERREKNMAPWIPKWKTNRSLSERRWRCSDYWQNYSAQDGSAHEMFSIFYFSNPTTYITSSASCAMSDERQQNQGELYCTQRLYTRWLCSRTHTIMCPYPKSLAFRHCCHRTPTAGDVDIGRWRSI